MRLLDTFAASLLLIAPVPMPAAATEPVAVPAAVETMSVSHTGDAADDPAIWVNAADAASSTVIGTDKQGGLAVYGLDGVLLQFVETGKPNNADVRYGLPLAGAEVDIVATADRSDNTLRVFKVDPATRKLEDIAAGPLACGFEVYGFCLYRDPAANAFYAFVTSKDGRVEQYELSDNGEGRVAARKVRAFDVGTQLEGCVADDELGHLYIGEEDVAIWKYPAKPDAEEARTIVDLHAPQGHLSPDIEGLTLFAPPGGKGYLIASSQGDSTFAVYRREGDNAYLGSFKLDGVNGVDAVTGTDGIDVTNAALGNAFPGGLFVAQDDENDGGTQNFKLVAWEAIAKALGL